MLANWPASCCRGMREKSAEAAEVAAVKSRMAFSVVCVLVSWFVNSVFRGAMRIRLVVARMIMGMPAYSS